MTKIVNFFAGPSAGKSTSAASLFSLMKWNGINCELVDEYAKQLTWDKNQNLLDTDQLYIVSKQNRKIRRLVGQVDYIITDSPIVLALLYTQLEPESFFEYVFELFNTYDNINYYVKRKKDYLKVGRSQTFEEAKEKDVECYSLLNDNNIEYTEIDGVPEAINEIFEDIVGYPSKWQFKEI